MPKLPKRRETYQRDAAMLLFGCGHLQGVAPGEMSKLYVEAWIREEEQRLIAGGCPPEAAKKLAEESRVNARNLHRDHAELLKGVRDGKAAAGEALVLRRIEELVLDRHKVALLQAECWRQFELGAADVGTEDRTEVKEPVEVEDPKKPDAQGNPGVRRMLRPQRVTTRLGSRTAARAGNSIWIERLLNCVKAEVEIGREIFELSAALDLPPELPDDLQALVGRKDAAARLAMQQARHLSRALGRATGKSMDPALVKLITAALGVAPTLPDRPDEPGGEAQEEGGLTFRIIGAKAEEVPS